MTKLVVKCYLVLREFKHVLFLSIFGLRSSCHHQPSCAEKTLLEIKSRGLIIGIMKGVVRALSCYQGRRVF